MPSGARPPNPNLNPSNKLEVPFQRKEALVVRIWGFGVRGLRVGACFGETAKTEEADPKPQTRDRNLKPIPGPWRGSTRHRKRWAGATRATL